MGFLSKKTTWSNAEFIPLKLCIASAYVLIGTYFSTYILAYKAIFFGIFGVTVALSMYLWVTKMKKQNP
ncbi:hypothetical protein ACLI1A_08475 [Flavobacterium sp. RHBU_3]|uniref:hypothetical protein n=1 Tax=Flavobacterium sp. RHBU_3 TaxID=3391184 RepID=UPI003984F60F